MPAVSGRQYRAMQAAAHGDSRLGIPRKVAREYVRETPETKRRAFTRAVGQQLARRRKDL
jgi:hypothetical protein